MVGELGDGGMKCCVRLNRHSALQWLAVVIFLAKINGIAFHFMYEEDTLQRK